MPGPDLLDGEDPGGQGVGHEEVGKLPAGFGQDGEHREVMVVLGGAQGSFEHGVYPPWLNAGGKVRRGV